jgi:signal transduction histidine kinase
MLARLRSRKWVPYGAASISLFVIWLLGLGQPGDPILQDQTSFNFFFLAVSIAAWLGGIWPAISTAVISCAVGVYEFSKSGAPWSDEVVTLFMFFVVSVIIGLLAESSHRALSRARKAERAKDEFMATVAHELRSPLSVIHYANTLDRISEEPARDHIDLIDEQVLHLNLMIQDLLDVSRVARGKIRLDRQYIDAGKLVDGAVTKAKPTIISRKHNLTVDLSHEPMLLYADPMRIEQVLANLLINAAKYTPDGGQILVRAQPVHDSVVFTVRDNGIGMSEEMLPRVFDLFVQSDAAAKNSEGGLGIGLALVRKVVELHEGSVRAFSAGADRGSEFTVTLPIATPAPVAPVLVAAK